MRDVHRPQRGQTRQNRGGNVQPHSQRCGIERKAPSDFTTVISDRLEVTEALQRRTLRVVRPHSLLNIGPCSHFNMEAQFSFNLTHHFVGTPPGPNEPCRGFDPGHNYNPLLDRAQRLDRCARMALPILLFDDELFPTRARQLVELRALIVFRHVPLRLDPPAPLERSEEQTSELQSPYVISY